MTPVEVPHETASAVADVIAFVRSLVGTSAAVRERRFEEPIVVVDITPVDREACPMSIVAEHTLVLSVGSGGARWEVSYDLADVATIKRVILGVVDGRVTERSGRGRSRVTVTFEDGTAYHATRYGVLAWLPQPGWNRRGALTTYRPYRT